MQGLEARQEDLKGIYLRNPGLQDPEAHSSSDLTRVHDLSQPFPSRSTLSLVYVIEYCNLDLPFSTLFSASSSLVNKYGGSAFQATSPYKEL